MLSKKTAIGIGIGAFLIIWGSIFLIPSFGKQTQSIEESIAIRSNTVYQFDADNQFHEAVKVSGNSFHVTIKSPGSGYQINDDFQKEQTFVWDGTQSGEHRIEISNIGDSSVKISGTLEYLTNPLEYAKHMLPIISGIIIIGISSVFSVRKPRGF